MATIKELYDQGYRRLRHEGVATLDLSGMYVNWVQGGTSVDATGMPVETLVSNCWEPARERMALAKAFEQEPKRVRRAIWEPRRYISVSCNGVLDVWYSANPFEEAIASRFIEPYSPTVDDLLTSDWEILL